MADRFGWLGQTRSAAVAARIEDELADWWRDWATEPARGWVPSEDKDGDVDELAWQVWNGRLALKLSGPLAHVLAALPAEQAGGALAAHVERSARRDLWQRLAGSAFESSSSTRATELGASLLDPRLGAFHGIWWQGCLCLEMRIARPLIDAWVPLTSTVAPATLHRRDEALGAQRIPLQARLELGRIALSELRALQPGDVLATLTPLEQNFELRVRGGDRVLASARLGQYRQRHALLLNDEHRE